MECSCEWLTARYLTRGAGYTQAHKQFSNKQFHNSALTSPVTANSLSLDRYLGDFTSLLGKTSYITCTCGGVATFCLKYYQSCSDWLWHCPAFLNSNPVFPQSCVCVCVCVVSKELP